MLGKLMELVRRHRSQQAYGLCLYSKQIVYWAWAMQSLAHTPSYTGPGLVGSPDVWKGNCVHLGS